MEERCCQYTIKILGSLIFAMGFVIVSNINYCFGSEPIGFVYGIIGLLFTLISLFFAKEYVKMEKE